MYNPYQRMSFIPSSSIYVLLSKLKEYVLTSVAPGLYGRPPEYGAYPGAPPGMGESTTSPTAPAVSGLLTP